MSSFFRKKMPFVLQEIGTYCDIFVSLRNGHIARASCVQDIKNAVPAGLLLDGLFRGASIKTGWDDHHLEKKVQNLQDSQLELMEYLIFRSQSSLVKIILTYGFDHTFPTPPRSRQIHALAFKTGLVKDEWILSRIMALYQQEGRSVGSIERIFQNAQGKDILLYNQMMSVYSKHDTKDAETLFSEMMNTKIVRPNDRTYMALLEGWSIECNPDKVIQLLHSMKNCGIQLSSAHYGVLIDVLARMRNPLHIQMAIYVLKKAPVSQNQYSFNAILSRCVPMMKPSCGEESEVIKETIRHAQDLVDFLDRKRFNYGVLEKTRWRLEAQGLKWPESVKAM